MEIGIAYDKNKPETKQKAFEVAEWLRKRKHKTYFNLGDRILKKLDFVITFGGDGLVLHTANKIRDYEIPMIRVNFGYVGFLTNFRPEFMFEKLSQIFERDNYIITKRTRISVAVWSDSYDVILKCDALNDIVIERNATRAIAIDVLIDGDRKQYRGDGFIFATRTGSTAYAESAGGPTLIGDDKFILRVVSPSNRELLPYLIKSSNIHFQIDEIIGNARLVIDGNRAMNLKTGQKITIKRSDKPTLFVEIGDIEKIKRCGKCQKKTV